jgi:hypothetical protein
MRIVAWLTWWRVLDAGDRVVAVCETLDEAEAFIANQPALRGASQ